ncbi:hypothetical protein GCM10009123_16170 [Kangiella japonica]|uniref:Uncharacterized protein n=1 Tax=Kangiella japonica TaxID=647384 RepID=A0ABN0T1M1_9GAMM
MEESTLIQTLAVWGAVTGTIGTVIGVISLILRFRAHKRDNPSLLCAADFSFEHSSGGAVPKHKITIRSVGRRPVSVDYIRYFMKPQRRWHSIFRRYHWSQKRWVYDQSPRQPINLSEGKRADILINLPNGFPLDEVLKAEVHDQAGNKWKVTWPRPNVLKRLIRNEKLNGIEKSNDRQQCKVIGYVAGDYFRIYAQWNQQPGSKSSSKGQFFTFRKREDYEKKFTEIEGKQVPRFLAEEISSIS